MEGLVQCSANYIALSPISFLERAAIVYGEKVSVIYGSAKTSWRETHERCVKLASALVLHLGISPGHTVAAFSPNVPALFELHFGVPMAGAVLSALNTRLDSPMLALLLQQLEPKIIFVYHELVEVVEKALSILSERSKSKPPQLVLIPENYDQITLSPSTLTENPAASGLDYNGLLAMGKADFETIRPNNECDPISVNYTSGSTGIPKGAIYSHRAAYLNSIAAIFRTDIRQMPVFLWTVDMFRCNGWCFTWAMAAVGGTNIFLGNEVLSAKLIFEAIDIHKVTHFCGAPTILNIIADAPASDQRQPLTSRVDIIVAGALPAPQVLMKVTELGFNLSQGYGMTEALGPAIVVPWEPRWQYSSKSGEQTEITKPREGTHNLLMDGVDVKDPKTMKSIPHDGKTIGEVMFRGNALMLGYLKNSKAGQEAFRGGWYRTGDVAVRHPDGCIQMKDRAKDVIISSGGEPISTIEVEAVLRSHSKVLEAAVVGRALDDDDDLQAGPETPCAFVELKKGISTDDACTAEEIIKFCGDRLPKYMVPQSVVFGDIQVTSTGKIQKFVLREKVKAAIHGGSGTALQNGIQ